MYLLQERSKTDAAMGSKAIAEQGSVQYNIYLVWGVGDAIESFVFTECDIMINDM